MKKLLLIIVCSFLLVFFALLLTRKNTASSTSKFLKTIAAESLKESGSLNVAGSSYRMYLYEDSVYLLMESQQLVAVDTNLQKAIRQNYPFSTRPNTVWYFNKEGSTNSYLTFPNGNIIQTVTNTRNYFDHKGPVNNCVNTGAVFWGQTFDSSDKRSFITTFDINKKTVQEKYNLFEIFRNSKGYSAECFNASMDGSFIKINDSAFLFYNYYSSYFLWFNNDSCKIYIGTDSLPLREFKKISTKVEGLQVLRCVADKETFTHLSGCSDGRYVYMLSNISSSKARGQRLIDVYRAKDMLYVLSYILPNRKGKLPYGIATSDSAGSLFVAYDGNSLVKFIKPI